MEEMMRECCAKKTIGMPVYSILEGQQLGTVKSLIIDHREKKLGGIVVDWRRGRNEERLIPFEHIQGIGEDVITVDKNASGERRGLSSQYMQRSRSPIDLVGSRVFSIGGKILGKVDEFRFNSQTGEITMLEISGTGAIFKDRFSVDSCYIKTIAMGTVMVADAALDNIKTLASSLSSGISEAREKAGELISATRKLSESLGEKLRRQVEESPEQSMVEQEDIETEEAPEKQPVSPLGTEAAEPLDAPEEGPAAETVEEIID